MKPLYDRKELKRLKDNYYKARALYETVKETAEEIQNQILTEHEFFESPEWTEKMVSRGGSGIRKRITRGFDSYLMEDDDFQRFLDLCYAEYKKAGIDDPRGREYCPEAESENLYHKAEKMLVEYAIEIVPDGMTEKETLRKATKNFKYKGKILDLILKLEC